jgi:hypothetical protein
VSGGALDAAGFADTVLGRLNERDVEGFLAYIDPDAEFVPLLGGVDPGDYTGHAGVRRWLHELWENWAGYSARADATDVVSDRVAVVEIAFRVRAHGSGVALETKSFGVFVRDETLRYATGWRFFDSSGPAFDEAHRLAASTDGSSQARS